MFDAAGVFGGRFRIHAEADEVTTQKDVSFIDGGSDSHAFGKESDRSVGSHLNQAAFAKFFHGDAYARFGKVELIYDIDRADLPLTLF